MIGTSDHPADRAPFDPCARMLTGVLARRGPARILGLWAGLALLVSPAGAGVSVVGSLVREFTLAPGGEARGRVLVSNRSDQPQAVRAYLTDFDPRAGGQGFPEAGTEVRSNSGWLFLLPAEQVLPPRTTGSVSVVLRVPEAAGMSGTYWSMLMIEGVSPDELAPPATEEGRARVTVRERFRTGVRLTTHVTGGAAAAVSPSVRFAERELLTTAEGAALRLRLENDGTVGVQLRLWVEVFDHEGYSLGRYSPQMATMTLLPGGSGERHVSLADLPPGTYDCLVIADNEDQNVFGARYQIEIAPPAPPAPAVP
jgi:hypothetical protein